MLIVRLFPWAVAIGVLAACAKTISATPPTETPLTQLAGSEWGLNGYDTPFIQFGAKGEMNGNGGCNNFGGSYEVNGSRLIVGPIMSTKKACFGDVMKMETGFFKALQKAHRFEATHSQLFIFDENNVELLALKRKDWD